MTNKEFLVELQKSCHLDLQQCLMLTDNLQKMLGKAAVDQIPVLVSGLGVFVSHKHPEYIQEDKQTGAMTLYPPRITYRLSTDNVDDNVSASLLLSEYSKIDEDTASIYLNGMVSIINSHLSQGEEIEVPGIGVFRNVITHQSDLNHLSYSPDQKLKELVNTPFSCFEPLVISEGKTITVQDSVIESDSELEVINEEELPLNESEERQEPVSEVVEKLEAVSEVVENQEAVSEIIENQEAVSEVIENQETSIESEPDEVKSAKEIIVVENISTNDQNADNNVAYDAVVKKQDSSENKILYGSLALILLCSAFVIWLIFFDKPSYNNNLQDAVIVEQVDHIAPKDSTIDTISQQIVEEKPVEIIETKKVEPEEVTPAATPTIPPVQKKSESGYHRLLDSEGKPVMVTLQQGERLTLIALNHFGDKSFWPYIFDVNTDKLKAPNLIQAGMKLYLPDPEFYHIDVNDPESLRKAKNRAAQLLK